MRYTFATLIFLAALLWGCAGSRGIEHSTMAVSVTETVHPGNYTLIYSIPQTTIRVTVETSRTVTRRGPYHEYAERFLGVSGVPDQDETTWRIENINIDSYLEADPDHYYSVVTNDPHVAGFFKLEKEGFVLPINRKQLPELDSQVYGSTTDKDYPLYTDLSIHPRVVEETRTVMRMVRQDTAFVNVPVMQRQSVTKSLEAKAAEAADLIFELRSNRFKLLSGDLDLFPDGKALDVIINEFARLEREYLSLFTGKSFESRHEFSFDYIPGKTAVEGGQEYEILFRFSESAGVLPATDVSGRPIAIELYSEMKTTQLDRVSAMPASRRDDPARLIYRVPDVATVRLIDGKEELSSKRMLVSQYGRIISIPANFLWD